MNWSNAKNYCVSQGGKAPLVNNSTSWDGSGTWTADGFGTGVWPSGLPYYWMGTEYSSSPGYAWVVDYVSGNVNANVSDLAGQSYDCRVVCVP